MMRFLFFIWVLSLPFNQLSIVSNLSIDNMLAPFIFAVWLINFGVRGQTIPAYQIRNIFKSVAVAVLYLLSHSIGLISTQEAGLSTIFFVSKEMLYFLIPILFINSSKDLKIFNDTIILITIIACITALFSALGLIELDFSRQAESRIGIESLQKSVGVISSYGDVAILLSLSLLYVIAGRKERVLFGKGSNLKILLVIIVALIGIASMQSRNIILTIMASAFSYWVLGHWMKRSRTWYKTLYIAIFLSLFFITAIIVLFYEPLLEFVQSIGGTKEAAGTVSDRLTQYSFMWNLVKDRMLIGVEPSIYEKHLLEIYLIHNLWLKELVQGGLLSVIAMFALWWRALNVQVANYRRETISSDARTYISVLLGILVATQFYPGGTLIFWVILGACSAMPFSSGAIKHKINPTNQ